MSEIVSEERKGFRIERVTLASPSLEREARPVRFVHLSDLHLARLRPRHRRLIDCVNDWQPDFVCLTGDLISLTRSTWPLLGEFAGQLRAAHGVFACIGNWEIKTGARYEAMRRFGERCGLTFLVNDSRLIRTEAGVLRLCGLDDVALGWPVWEDALDGRESASYTILMAHAPLAARLVRPDMQVDLILSGHTHGGQMRIPLLWRLFLPSCHGDLIGGLYRTDWGYVYANRGFGAAPRLPLRLFCPPEAAFFTLAGSRRGK